MTDESQPPAPPAPLAGLVITVIVVLALAGWIALGLTLLGITSFFASFLFFWYWAAVEQADMKQWPQSVLGAFVGLGLAWQSHWLPAQFGTPGLIAGLVVIVVALYIQIVNWVPIAINRSAMLFLTVLAAPILLEKLDPLEMAKAIGLGALYFGAIVKVLTMLSAPKTG